MREIEGEAAVSRRLKLVLCLCAAASLFACGGSSTSPDAAGTGDVVPMFADDNGNAVNDYFERQWHGVDFSAAGAAQRSGEEYTWRHRFRDGDGDGICDGSQDGSPTWHGPGFTDADGDGICDYWDEDRPEYGSHGGMRFRDRNRNRVNDYVEAAWHEGNGHAFRDGNGDGICDASQDGGTAWHGPGFTDADGDGICDHWQPGGRGHGHHHGRS